jgi:RNA-directed DNA polymerase
MKRLSKLWPQVLDFANLYLAYRKARRGKQNRDAVAAFSLNLENELLRLHTQLQDHSYCPGAYRLFTVYERKPRQIAAAPFCDRVVHHALMNVVEPLLDQQFIFDSYACRKGKGVHQAVARYQTWSQQYRYALKMDIARYFPSIDRERLNAKLARRIKDPDVLWLFGEIIATAPGHTGLPIGNLTSQFLANLYLDAFDHFIKETLGLRAYLRYVDDFIVLGDDKRELTAVREAAREFLAIEKLALHPRKAHISPTRLGLDVLGYRVFPDFRRLRPDNGWRFTRKLRRFAQAYAQGDMEWSDFDPAVQSWLGHARHANTQGLRETIFSGILFNRESAGRASA